MTDPVVAPNIALAHEMAVKQHADGGSPQDIRAEIEQLRAELGAVAAELVDQFTPAALVNRAKESAGNLVSDATSADADPDRQKRARIILAGAGAAVALGIVALVRGRSR